jgi:hypothetical protein
VESADADCSGAVDPTDALLIYNAWVAGLSPASCIGGGGAARGAPALRWGRPESVADGLVALPLLAHGAPPRALGLEIELGGGATWAGAAAGPAGDWRLLEAGSPGEGRIRVGALDPDGASRPGEIARLLLRAGPDDTGWVRVVGAPGANFAGPTEAPIADGAGPVPEGIAAVGPVPADGRLEVRYGIARPGAAVELRILDVTGRTVRTLAAGAAAGTARAGLHTAVWDGRDEGGLAVAAGVYFVHLRVDGRAWTRKAALVR